MCWCVRILLDRNVPGFTMTTSRGLTGFFSHLFSTGDENGEQPAPTCFDYFMHILCVFWKILFACVPPTEYWNGWACFLVSVVVIGFLTAAIGDVASHFGCTVGLKDTVTAVVFVALGTSLPGRWFY